MATMGCAKCGAACAVGAPDLGRRVCKVNGLDLSAAGGGVQIARNFITPGLSATGEKAPGRSDPRRIGPRSPPPGDRETRPPGDRAPIRAPSSMQQPPSACGLRLQPTGPGGFPPESR